MHCLCGFLGTDVTVVAHSRFVGMSLEAAEELQSKDGISCEVRFYSFSLFLQMAIFKLSTVCSKLPGQPS